MFYRTCIGRHPSAEMFKLLVLLDLSSNRSQSEAERTAREDTILLHDSRTPEVTMLLTSMIPVTLYRDWSGVDHLLRIADFYIMETRYPKKSGAFLSNVIRLFYNKGLDSILFGYGVFLLNFIFLAIFFGRPCMCFFSSLS